MPETGIAAGAESDTFYTLEVPAGATNLVVTTAGGTGDADLYVRFGSQPTLATFDCRSWTPTNNETCTFQPPTAGRYHILVYGYSAYTGLSLDVDYD